VIGSLPMQGGSATSSVAAANRRGLVDLLTVMMFSLGLSQPLVGCVQLVRRNGRVHLCFAVIALKPESTWGRKVSSIPGASAAQ